jgi:hypothetical protein
LGQAHMHHSIWSRHASQTAWPHATSTRGTMPPTLL